MKKLKELIPYIIAGILVAIFISIQSMIQSKWTYFIE